MKKTILGISLILAVSSGIAIAAAINFSDVAGNAWFAQSLDRNVQRGIINGYTDGTFKPANAVNRAEASAITDKAISYMVANDLAFDFYVWANNQTIPQEVKINNIDILVSAPNAGGQSKSVVATDGIKNLAEMIGNQGTSAVFACKYELKDELRKNNKTFYYCKVLGSITTKNTVFGPE